MKPVAFDFINIGHVTYDLAEVPIDDLFSNITNTSKIHKYWSGELAPVERHFTSQMLWSDEYLYVRFEYEINEPPVVSETPDTSKKTVGLWERDVCEIFIAPDKIHPETYFEFEIAPTGEWLDLAIEHRNGERFTDWEYSSGVKAFAKTDDRISVMTLQIPFATLGKTPSKGDIWLGNIYRCVGSGDNRGYLAWQPTLTPQPNFHAPERFGKFVFA